MVYKTELFSDKKDHKKRDLFQDRVTFLNWLQLKLLIVCPFNLPYFVKRLLTIKTSKFLIHDLNEKS